MNVCFHSAARFKSKARSRRFDSFWRVKTARFVIVGYPVTICRFARTPWTGPLFPNDRHVRWNFKHAPWRYPYRQPHSAVETANVSLSTPVDDIFKAIFFVFTLVVPVSWIISMWYLFHFNEEYDRGAVRRAAARGFTRRWSSCARFFVVVRTTPYSYVFQKTNGFVCTTGANPTGNVYGCAQIFSPTGRIRSRS